jgi:hypothetical protein
MPKTRLKSFKPFNSSTAKLGKAHWKAIIHIYSLKKFLKNHKFIAFIVACPKMLKAILASLH